MGEKYDVHHHSGETGKVRVVREGWGGDAARHAAQNGKRNLPFASSDSFTVHKSKGGKKH